MKKIIFKRNYKVELIFTKKIFKTLKELVSQEDVCITDENLVKFYGKKLREIFGEKIFKIVPGEESKGIKTVIEISSYLSELNLSRNSKIFGFGGGVVGDITGFVAGIYKRGIGYFLIPTSLLSFVDSSIGGKTGINTEWGKNYLGLFNHPEKILFDFNLLKTLPEREFQNGLFELLKYGFVLDRDIFFKFKEGNFRKNLKESVKKAILIKTEIVEKDEREKNLRKVLNFGHTFGHILEKVTDYKVYSHGEAVGFGMIFAFLLGKELKITSPQYVSEGIDTIKKIKKLNFNLEFSFEEILKALMYDKKIMENKRPFFVLTPQPGKFLFKEIENIKILEKTYRHFLESFKNDR